MGTISKLHLRIVSWTVGRMTPLTEIFLLCLLVTLHQNLEAKPGLFLIETETSSPAPSSLTKDGNPVAPVSSASPAHTTASQGGGSDYRWLRPRWPVYGDVYYDGYYCDYC